MAAAGTFPLGQPLEGQRTEDDDVLDLRDLWRMVVKHKWLLLGMAMAGLLAALLFSLVRTPLYLATTTLQVDKRAPRVVKFGQELDPTAEELDDRTGLGTQLELLKSRVLAERVIDELRLDHVGALPQTAFRPQAEGDVGAATEDDSAPPTERGLLERIQDSWNKLLEPATASAEKINRDAVLEAFQKTVNVQQVRNTRLLRIEVENPDPQLAARIANTMAQAFIALNLERRLDSSSYAKTFLEQQLALTKARLEESERRLNQYARSNNLLTLDEKTNVTNQTFTEFSTALAKAEQDRIRIESEYEAVRTNPDAARQVLENRAIQELKLQRSRLDAEYQQNAKIYKDDFPRMQQLRAQINEVDAKIQSEVAYVLDSLNKQLDMAKRQEAALRARLTQTRGEIVRAQDVTVEYNLLKREVDTNRELYNGLLQQLKEVGVAGGVESNNIQVVDKADIPLFPHKPKIPLNAAIGLMAGLVLGLVVVFLIESMDDSIKFADEVEKTLHVPLIGVIPKVKDKSGLPSIALLAHEDPRCHVAEAYRSVRTALQFSTSDGAPRRLVITSTAKNEGKSTTALALAINFAQLGARVALIDADMRNPTLHKFLGLSNTTGLSNVLTGQPVEMERLLHETMVPNLYVVTAGPIPPNPVDLLMGPKLGELMDDLQAQGFEYLIIDGPPVLGLADAIVLGNQVPAMLYVAQASHTRKSHIRDAFRRLRMAGIVPLGVVLTKTTAQNTAYYTYESYYGYGASPTPSAGRIEPAMSRT